MPSFFDMYPYSLYIKVIAQRVREIIDQLLKDHGLNSSQAILLSHIHQSIEEHIEINRKYLEKTMALSGPSVTNLLNGLEKSGFITRTSNPKDGRNLRIDITDKAKQFLSERSDAFSKSEELITQGMSDAEKAMFVSLLTRAFENVEKLPPNG
ncbi:MarR family transcriptional regulator [Paenibacillus favisporus]|uniref:MarR family winged helix-turn-helix transcriptional regulator n=1 Tax=Paenibacillus TaxID=44249 RepID=UPI00190D13C7|nr:MULTISPECIES: MarR family transcriptional regulator [Paenibacillus]MBJ9990654.1 MarR family transcriptional regulator [Paenibacillus sp. S28]MEC0176914.1 MarR family transcriptional regulator [Paenibacillus favisporus]